MRKCVLATILVMLLFFMLSASGTTLSVYAATRVNTQTSSSSKSMLADAITVQAGQIVKVYPASKTYCDTLLRENPGVASRGNGCNITIVSKTVESPISGNIHPDTCYGGTINHSATYYGPFYLFHATLYSAFHYDGHCDAPTAYQPNCTRDMVAYVPYSGVTNTSCYSQQDNVNPFDEGDWVTGGTGVPTVSFFMQSVANPANTTINDYY